ncbi:MAG TPA: M24 family metallopeptidase [Hyphomicrobiaceae bacterium]|nr:M24 family metallopeptidase [Hyphomicrobiaceae bacterium]
MTTDTAASAAFPRRPLPKRFCNLDRVLHALEARGLDGIVATVPTNVFYLSGFNGIAHKSDEPRVCAVILSRHAPEHPIMVVADYYLATFLEQSTWIEDIRPFRAVMMPLDLPAQKSDIDRFIPLSARGTPWVENARKQYAFDMATALKGALREVKLDRAKVAFDDQGFGLRLGMEGLAVADGYDPMMFARAIKTPVELDLIRRATRLNEAAIRKTIAFWQKGATWRDLNIAYACSVAELGGFVRDPGGMVWGHPRGTDQTIMLATGFEDSEVEAGTHVMFDCHGTIDLYCWDGGKTWVVDGEPEGDAKRWAKATSAVAETLLAAMKPGGRIRELQALARATYRKAGVPDPDRTVIFFHGLGLSHMELELMTSDGTVQGGDWVLEEGMVAPIHLLYPGGQFDRSWCEEVVEIRSDGGRPLFSWGFDPITGS